jgi:Metallo-beta-lactamase superfamily
MPTGAYSEEDDMIEVELLPARYGDGIWVRYGKTKNDLRHVLIDTGFEPTANGIRQRLRDAPDIEVELFVLTHIDADHIEGSIYLLQDVDVVTPTRFKDVWFNGWDHIDSVEEDGLGALQGEYFSTLIRKRKLRWNDRTFGGKAVVVPETGPLPHVKLPGGMELTLLSPSVAKLKALRSYWLKDLKGRIDPGDAQAALTMLAEDSKYAPDALGTKKVETLVAQRFEEDDAKANGSSIAFLAEYEGKRMLFTGDAHPSVLVDAIDRLADGQNPLNIDLLKLAHHASKHNTSPALLQRVRCKHALISTNGAKFKHPDDECIARLIDSHRNKGLTLHFNYDTEFNRRWKDAAVKRKYGYTVEYGTEGSLALTL